MDWTLEIAFHWPHDRFAFGWDIMRPDEQYDYYTFKVYFLNPRIFKRSIFGNKMVKYFKIFSPHYMG